MLGHLRHSINKLVATASLLKLQRLPIAISPKRLKYITAGVKGGNKSKKFSDVDCSPLADEFDLNDDDDDELGYDAIVSSTMHVTNNILNEQRVFVIQPYVKWGPKKLKVSPELMLAEAVSLVQSVPHWTVASSLQISLESLEKQNVFGSGKIIEIKEQLKASQASCLFISKGILTEMQKRSLEREFGIPVVDRYSVVIQIFRLHATSTEAKLQVAMAEIPYIWSQKRESGLNDTQRRLLRARERKLKIALTNIRMHRELLRQKRLQRDFPVVAIVGYTNAGKTSLIKTLTMDTQLKPCDKLFATLDVTAHAAKLPCQLECIFMDTVGFMADLPSELLECFFSTLEDAMLADVIVHVNDVSHPNHMAQKTHVETTLTTLMKRIGPGGLLPPVINVGNKIDLVPEMNTSELDASTYLISSHTQVGIEELLLAIESKILSVSGRQKLIMRVPAGGPETAWLYKNAAVAEMRADPDNSQLMLLDVIISASVLEKFKNWFAQRNTKKINH